MRFRAFYAFVVAAVIALAGIAPASADAGSDTRRYYDSIAAAAVVLAELLKDTGDIEATATAIVETVSKPLSAAGQAWMDEAFNKGNDKEQYRPYAACDEAASSLKMFGLAFVRYFRGYEKTPPKADDIDPFRRDLGRCEEALGLEKTFS